MVSTGSRVDNMTPLYRIANLDELWLEINIPQEHISDLNIGDRVLIENTGAEAEIKQLGQSVNPETQTVLAKALIKDNASAVRVGQKVTVQVIQENEAVTYKLPDVAIANHEGKAYIFIKTQEGFKVSQIKVVGKQLNVSVITGQLTGDERIAINNAVTLKANWLGLGSDE
jgi:cobalt-zinc-cadmium efflux system membrane fusion protein